MEAWVDITRESMPVMAHYLRRLVFWPSYIRRQLCLAINNLTLLNFLFRQRLMEQSISSLEVLGREGLRMLKLF